MSQNHFRHFASPVDFVAVDAGEKSRFKGLRKSFPGLFLFDWDSRSSDQANFQRLVNQAVEHDLTKLLIGGCSVDQSCLVISLLALGRGFDVYVCADLIDGDDPDEMRLLIERLKQHGALIVSLHQVRVEFAAARSASE